MASNPEAARKARALLRSNANGILSTLSVEMAGWPFGSLTPYVLDHAGTPHILISRLAEHTRNIGADPRVSLIVWEGGQGRDALAVGRATVLARARETEVDGGFRARFLRYLPETEGFLALGDFRFYRLDVERVRYIGGFGAIHWIEPGEFLLAPAPALVAAEETAVAHMNADHQQAMRHYCRRAYALDCQHPQMLGLDPEGFDLASEHGRHRYSFPQPVHDAASLRAALVAMARED